MDTLPLTSLPTELLLIIFSVTPEKSLWTLASTCRYLNSLIVPDILSRKLEGFYDDKDQRLQINNYFRDTYPWLRIAFGSFTHIEHLHLNITQELQFDKLKGWGLFRPEAVCAFISQLKVLRSLELTFDWKHEHQGFSGLIEDIFCIIKLALEKGCCRMKLLTNERYDIRQEIQGMGDPPFKVSLSTPFALPTTLATALSKFSLKAGQSKTDPSPSEVSSLTELHIGTTYFAAPPFHKVIFAAVTTSSLTSLILDVPFIHTKWIRPFFDLCLPSLSSFSISTRQNHFYSVSWSFVHSFLVRHSTITHLKLDVPSPTKIQRTKNTLQSLQGLRSLSITAAPLFISLCGLTKTKLISLDTITLHTQPPTNDINWPVSSSAYYDITLDKALQNLASCTRSGTLPKVHTLGLHLPPVMKTWLLERVRRGGVFPFQSTLKTLQVHVNLLYWIKYFKMGEVIIPFIRLFEGIERCELISVQKSYNLQHLGEDIGSACEKVKSEVRHSVPWVKEVEVVGILLS